MEMAECQYLAFSVGKERFAISLKNVHEVLGVTRITKLPCRAPYILGLINLRGSAVPVIDLRRRLGIVGDRSLEDCAIVVAELQLGKEAVIAGLLADAVHEVISLDPRAIDEPPMMGENPRATFFEGVAKMGEGFLIVLNADGLFEDSLD